MPAYVHPEKCQKNYSCIGVCPVSAISKDKGNGLKSKVNPDICIECQACISACPIGAITLEAAAPATEEQAPTEPQDSNTQ